MTFDKASKLSAGCEVFDNQSGKKILVTDVMIAPFHVVIQGKLEGEFKEQTWTHDKVT